MIRPAELFFDEAVLRHGTGRGHPETAGRVASAVDALRREGWSPQAPPSPGRTRQAVERVHDPGYVARFEAAAGRVPASAGEEAAGLFDSPDNPYGARSFDAALRSAGLALAAGDAVLSGRVPSAFVATRPPGHHALLDRAMGFCFFNTAAVLALDLLETWRLSRVLVADFDVHHGNGTQAIFWEEARVAYLSVHRFPFYPGSGAADERGAGAGLGTTVNVPRPAGDGDEGYAGAFERALEGLAERFRPEAVVVSAGFDAHASDPLGGMRLTTGGFGRMTEALAGVARAHAGGRIVSLLEGGYDPAALGESCCRHVAALPAREEGPGLPGSPVPRARFDTHPGGA